MLSVWYGMFLFSYNWGGGGVVVVRLETLSFITTKVETKY